MNNYWIIIVGVCLITLGLFLPGVSIANNNMLTNSTVVYDAGFRTKADIVACFNITDIDDKMHCLGFVEVNNTNV